MKINNEIIISIIIPVYNLENRNLDRCIQSILNQTYKNFELILINDGSTDNSEKICEQYIYSDNRIKLINQQNGGVSSARNKGIDYSKGTYIAFIDGDDYVDENYLEHFVQLLPADLIIQSCKDFCYDYDKAKTQYHFENKSYNNNFYELFSKYNLYNWGAPWARLYKTNIIKQHNIKFNTEIRYREDELFFLQYLRFCQVIKTDSYYGYHYIWYPTSATNKYYGFDHDFKIATQIYAASLQLGEEKNFNASFFETISYKCISSLFSGLSSMYKHKIIQKRKERIIHIKEIKTYLHINHLDTILNGKYKMLNLSSSIIDYIFYWKSKIITNNI